MVVIWPRRSMVVPRGSLGVDLGDDLFHRRAHRAQVAAVDVGVDIEHRLHVVVVDDFRRHAAPDAGQVGEQLRAAGRGSGIAVGGGRLAGAGCPPTNSSRWRCRPAKSGWWC